VGKGRETERKTQRRQNKQTDRHRYAYVLSGRHIDRDTDREARAQIDRKIDG
jgi:hypothetical protein